MYRSEHEWIKAYTGKNALWIHDNNAKRPHAELTSGKHSNGFFNSRLVIEDEPLLWEAASDLVELTARHLFEVDGFVGPQTGATKLSAFLAVRAGCRIGKQYFSASPAKHSEGGAKSMLLSAEEADAVFQKRILLCEDVLTTGGSVKLAAEAVEKAGGIVLPYVLVLVNRSGFPVVGDKRIIALINRSMPMWEPEECELCGVGSKAIRPKDKENWAALSADYS